MNDYSMLFLAWFFASSIHAVAGLGGALIAIPIMAQFLPVDVLVPVATMITMVINGQMVITYWKDIKWSDLRYIIVGGFFGAAVGLYFLQNVSNDNLKALMAFVLIFYALYSLFFNNKPKKPVNEKWGFCAGFIASTLGAALGFNGPPIALYYTVSGWSEKTAKAIFGATLLLTSLPVLLGQIATGLQNAQTLKYFGIGGPAALLGASFGIYFSKYLKAGMYRRIVLGIIMFSGIMILESYLKTNHAI